MRRIMRYNLCMDSNLEPKDRLVTVREAGRLLGLGRSTVYKLVWSGELPSCRPSPRAVRIKLSDVLARMERKA